MKRLLGFALYGTAGLVMVVVAVAGVFRFLPLPSYPVHAATLAVPASPDRAAQGQRLVGLMCAGCHLDRESGALTGHPIDDVPAMFGRFHSANITRDADHGIGRWTDRELAYLLRTGIRRDGRLAVVMPAFPGLSDEDLASIIAFLRSDDPMTAPSVVPTEPPHPTPVGVAFARFVLKPLPLPEGRVETPRADDRVAFGRYVALRRLHCFGCHSADFTTNDLEQPERSKGFFGGGAGLRGADGRTIYSPNLTPDGETGIGGWTEAHFVRALKQGLRPDNTPLRRPMEPMPELTDEEAGAIYAYLRTVPALRNPRRADDGARVEAASVRADSPRGEAVFGKYCAGCHGTDGRMNADLARSARELPTQEQLTSWIRQPGARRPGARMPAFAEILDQEEIEAVAGHVRVLVGRMQEGGAGSQ